MASQPRPAAEEMNPIEPRAPGAAADHPVDQVAVAEEVDRRARGAVGDACTRSRASTGPPHSSMAASIDALSDRLTWMALAPASVTSAKSITTTRRRRPAPAPLPRRPSPWRPRRPGPASRRSEMHRTVSCVLLTT